MKLPGNALSLRTALKGTKAGERRRVSTFVGVLMGGIAGFFDALQFFIAFLNGIPIVGNIFAVVANWFIASWAYMIFYLVWFPYLDVKMTKGKPGKLVGLVLSAVLEATPLLDILPGITAGVVTTIILSRIEDAQYNKQHAKEIKAQNDLARKRQAAAAQNRAQQQAADEQEQAEQMEQEEADAEEAQQEEAIQEKAANDNAVGGAFGQRAANDNEAEERSAQRAA